MTEKKNTRIIFSQKKKVLVLKIGPEGQENVSQQSPILVETKERVWLNIGSCCKWYLDFLDLTDGSGSREQLT